MVRRAAPIMQAKDALTSGSWEKRNTANYVFISAFIDELFGHEVFFGGGPFSGMKTLG